MLCLGCFEGVIEMLSCLLNLLIVGVHGQLQVVYSTVDNYILVVADTYGYALVPEWG